MPSIRYDSLCGRGVTFKTLTMLGLGSGLGLGLESQLSCPTLNTFYSFNTSIIVIMGSFPNHFFPQILEYLRAEIKYVALS